MLQRLEGARELNGRVGIKATMLDRSSGRCTVDLYDMTERSTGRTVPAQSVNVKQQNLLIIDVAATATALENFVRAVGLCEVLRKMEYSLTDHPGRKDHLKGMSPYAFVGTPTWTINDGDDAICATTLMALAAVDNNGPIGVRVTSQARAGATLDALSVAIPRVKFDANPQLYVGMLLLFVNCYEAVATEKQPSARADARGYCRALVEIASDPARARALTNPGAGPMGEWTDMLGYSGDTYTPGLLAADGLVHLGSMEQDGGNLDAAEARYAEASERFQAELERAAREGGDAKDALVDQAESGLQRAEWALSCYHEDRAREGMTCDNLPPGGLRAQRDYPSGFVFPTSAEAVPRYCFTAEGARHLNAALAGALRCVGICDRVTGLDVRLADCHMRLALLWQVAGFGEPSMDHAGRAWLFHTASHHLGKDDEGATLARQAYERQLRDERRRAAAGGQGEGRRVDNTSEAAPVPAIELELAAAGALEAWRRGKKWDARSASVRCGNVECRLVDEEESRARSDEGRGPQAAGAAEAEAEARPGKSSFKWCGACVVVKYCSGECQKEAWKAHKPVCARAKEVKETLAAHRKERDGASEARTTTSRDSDAARCNLVLSTL